MSRGMPIEIWTKILTIAFDDEQTLALGWTCVCRTWNEILKPLLDTDSMILWPRHKRSDPIVYGTKQNWLSKDPSAAALDQLRTAAFFGYTSLVQWLFAVNARNLSSPWIADCQTPDDTTNVANTESGRGKGFGTLVEGALAGGWIPIDHRCTEFQGFLRNTILFSQTWDTPSFSISKPKKHRPGSKIVAEFENMNVKRKIDEDHLFLLGKKSCVANHNKKPRPLLEDEDDEEDEEKSLLMTSFGPIKKHFEAFDEFGEMEELGEKNGKKEKEKEKQWVDEEEYIAIEKRVMTGDRIMKAMAMSAGRNDIERLEWFVTLLRGKDGNGIYINTRDLATLVVRSVAGLLCRGAQPEELAAQMRSGLTATSTTIVPTRLMESALHLTGSEVCHVRSHLWICVASTCSVPLVRWLIASASVKIDVTRSLDSIFSVPTTSASAPFLSSSSFSFSSSSSSFSFSPCSDSSSTTAFSKTVPLATVPSSGSQTFQASPAKTTYFDENRLKEREEKRDWYREKRDMMVEKPDDLYAGGRGRWKSPSRNDKAMSWLSFVCWCPLVFLCELSILVEDIGLWSGDQFPFLSSLYRCDNLWTDISPLDCDGLYLFRFGPELYQKIDPRRLSAMNDGEHLLSHSSSLLRERIYSRLFVPLSWKVIAYLSKKTDDDVVDDHHHDDDGVVVLDVQSCDDHTFVIDVENDVVKNPIENENEKEKEKEIFGMARIPDLKVWDWWLGQVNECEPDIFDGADARQFFWQCTPEHYAMGAAERYGHEDMKEWLHSRLVSRHLSS